jgi:peptidoglycan-associated lipoprotein
MVKKCGAMALILMVIVLGLLVISCAKKDIQADQGIIEGEDGNLDAEIVENDEQISGANEEETLTEEQLEAQRREEKALAVKKEFVNENIYFGFDSATLTEEAQTILRKKAQWLEDNPEVVIVIEGHCDNRGTEAYNLALGERRAESAKAFLSDLGINVTKIMTISYGEERPLDPDDTEGAWNKNRRASFVIQ